MTDAGESLASEAVRANGREIFKLFELGRGETLAQNRQVVSLIGVSSEGGLD